ncbi:hypothetical protein PR048_033566 [Dryococelus australis]|uniref:Uncharacterized protein n=1 Tax=Dryococelus australis TaxID=614101 RepID=A0ABQ9G1W1_9NEOP|nr:hypothetical protein PR048_033566 [Dryococelus australis]
MEERREQTAISEEYDEKFRGFDQSSRPKRKLKKPKHLDNFELYVAYCLMSECDPQTKNEAISESEEWRDGIQKELDAHKKFQTWISSVDPPDDVKQVEIRWVFQSKPDGTKKARNLRWRNWAELLKGEFNAKDMRNIQCCVGTEIKLVDNKIEQSASPHWKNVKECARVVAYADADWGGNKTDRKSVSGMASFHCGNFVSWSSKKQQAVVLSSAEKEYTSCSLAAS